MARTADIEPHLAGTSTATTSICGMAPEPDGSTEPYDRTAPADEVTDDGLDGVAGGGSTSGSPGRVGF